MHATHRQKKQVVGTRPRLSSSKDRDIALGVSVGAIMSRYDHLLGGSGVRCQPCGGGRRIMRKIIGSN